ncbi:pyocin knob domain-containing protein [uncultured Sphingomonas sp.]|uniref:pyocin knob domain-containing protein n=1 Tax=uncultured Sphingomonas sp. TaxID=158754 RepID=UPI0025941704|nr:pyocin knob domain-containing protein [uncultured Sphingomonas sp.]
MARIAINLGTPPTGADGDPVRTAFEKVNTMTTEIYDGLGKSVKKGDFGIGANNNAHFEGADINPDPYTTAGTYIGSFVVSGVTRTGWLIVSGGSDASICGQSFLDGDGAIYTRIKSGGAWQAWRVGMRAGDFGIGAVDGILSPGFGAQSRSGDYTFNPSTPGVDRVGGNYGVIRQGTYDLASGNWVQFIQKMHEPRAYLQGAINNSVNPVAELHTTFNSQLDPGAGTGGLMSAAQVGGWVIEKFLNGTLVLTGNSASVQLPANTISAHSFAIPSGLVSPEGTALKINLLPRGSNDCGLSHEYIHTPTIGVVQVRNGHIAQIFDFRIKIIGRWK